jgi:hypothetical protein
MKVTKAPGLMEYPYTIEATEEDYRAIRNAIPGENNQGYEIIKAETYHTCPNGSEERIVLGKIETRLGAQYVTWQSVRYADGRITDYFWGHYHDREDAALCDYYTRLAGKFE